MPMINDETQTLTKNLDLVFRYLLYKPLKILCAPTNLTKSHDGSNKTGNDLVYLHNSSQKIIFDGKIHQIKKFPKSSYKKAKIKIIMRARQKKTPL